MPRSIKNLGSPPDVDNEMVKDYPKPGKRSPRLIYRIHLDVAIRPRDWVKLDQALANNDSQTAYNTIVANINTLNRVPGVIALVAAALGHQQADGGRQGNGGGPARRGARRGKTAGKGRRR